MKVALFLATILVFLEHAIKKSNTVAINTNENTVTVPLNLAKDGMHYAVIGIGTPEQTFTIYFDSWTDIFWVPSTKCDATKFKFCVKHHKYCATESDTANPTTIPFVYNQYFTGLRGTITFDKITVGGKCLSDHLFGEVSEFDGSKLDESEFDGTIGLGFNAINLTASPFILKLKESGFINKLMFSVSQTKHSNGEIMFGGYNKQMYEGEPVFTPLTTSDSWQIVANKVSFGDKALCNKDCAAMVNDGSHHIYGPPDEIKMIEETFHCDPNDHCRVDCEKSKTFPKFVITIENKNFELTPDDYIKTKNGKCYSMFDHIDLPYWIFGKPFVNQIYTIYDIDNMQLGFAKSIDIPATTTMATTTSGAQLHINSVKSAILIIGFHIIKTIFI